MSEERSEYIIEKQEELVKQVKDIGQELINKAEAIVGDVTLMRDININIKLERDAAPNITVTKNTMPETTYERWMKEIDIYGR